MLKIFGKMKLLYKMNLFYSIFSLSINIFDLYNLFPVKLGRQTTLIVLHSRVSSPRGIPIDYGYRNLIYILLSVIVR